MMLQFLAGVLLGICFMQACSALGAVDEAADLWDAMEALEASDPAEDETDEDEPEDEDEDDEGEAADNDDHLQPLTDAELDIIRALCCCVADCEADDE